MKSLQQTEGYFLAYIAQCAISVSLLQMYKQFDHFHLYSKMYNITFNKKRAINTGLRIWAAGSTRMRKRNLQT